jgi:competence protein ComGC
MLAGFENAWIKMNAVAFRTTLRRPAGVTLIEVSLVIALLLGIVVLLFIGVGSLRKGSDKAKCKMQLASVQKVVRAQANFKDLAPGVTFATTEAFGAGMAMENAPSCPAGGAYTWLGAIPSIGNAYGACDFADTDGTTTHLLSAVDTKAW